MRKYLDRLITHLLPVGSPIFLIGVIGFLLAAIGTMILRCL
jgi:preprotein translocase subunit Sss1